MVEMRAITLWQPWASLIFAGWKKYETRNRHTFVRGPLLIHAAACKPKLPESCDWLTSQQQGDFSELLYDAFGCSWNHTLPTGAILGEVGLDECKTVDGYDVDAPEQLCGNWTQGRFAWRLTNPQRFSAPIPAKGSQGFWFYRGEAPNV